MFWLVLPVSEPLPYMRIPCRSWWRRSRSLFCALSIFAVLTASGCATPNHAQVGNVKIIAGKMGPTKLRWEIAKASLAGWEVVSVLGDGEDKVVTFARK